MRNLGDEACIISEVLDGQPKRFRRLVEWYGGPCLAYFSRIWRFDGETSRDLFQEAFFRAYFRLSQFRRGASFKAWFFAICRNLAIDHRARVHRRVPPPSGRISSPSAETTALSRIMLEEALEDLPDRQKQAFAMKYVKGLTCQEISRLLGIPIGTVKSELYHARLRLAEALDKETSR